MSDRNLVLNSLLIRSAQLEAEIGALLDIPVNGSAARQVCSRTLCAVSIEHAESVKMLIAGGNITSAVCLVRVQYETLVRALWLAFVADEKAIERMQATMNNESLPSSDRLPTLNEMISGLEQKGPPDVASQLLEFRDSSWKPLSSFVHGGIHALSRHSKGYPEPLLLQAIKASNGLLLMAGMLLVVVSAQPGNEGRVRKIQLDYLDCQPPLRGAGS